MRKRVVSAVLSALLPGAGQFYSHHWIKGGSFLAAALFFSGMVRRVSMGESSSLGQSIFLGNRLFIHLILLGLAIWSAVDGFRAPAKGKK